LRLRIGTKDLPVVDCAYAQQENQEKARKVEEACR